MSVTVAVTGMIGFSLTLVVFFLIYNHLHWLRNFRKHPETKKRARVLVHGCFAASFVLIGMYIAMEYGTGFFTRTDGITIFWPRYIAEALVSASLVVSLSVFLLLKHRYIFMFGFYAIVVNLALLVSAFTTANAYWAFYALAYVPLVVLFTLCYLHSRRCDCVAARFYWVVLIVEVLKLVVYALSQQAGNHISVSLENWLYLALEIISVIIIPLLLCSFYIPMNYAIKLLSVNEVRISKKQRSYSSVPTTSFTTSDTTSDDE